MEKVFYGLESKMKNEWQLWDKLPEYGDLLYKRALGEADEMESAKSISKLINKSYYPGMTICDVGCGAGHYLLSFQRRIDKNINYTGVDSTKYYLKLAKKAFNNKKIFIYGNIFKLPFKKGNFDMVVCNNVILHLPPPPGKPIAELIRIAKKYVIIRTLIGKSNYIIKRAYNSSELGEKTNIVDLVKADDKIMNFGYFNMYTKDYLEQMIKKIDKNLKVKIIPDKEFKKFDNTKEAGKTHQTATKVIGDKQISGNLIYDWRYIIIEK